MTIVSRWTLWNKPSLTGTVGGICNWRVWWIWHLWQVWMNHLMSSITISHQKQSRSQVQTVKTPLCPRSLWASLISPKRQCLGTTNWWQPCGSLRHRLPWRRKNFIAELTNKWNSVSERSASWAQVSRKPQIKRVRASLAMALVDRGIVGESGSAMGLEVEERRTKEYAEHRSVEEWVKGGSNPTLKGQGR